MKTLVASAVIALALTSGAFAASPATDLAAVITAPFSGK